MQANLTPLNSSIPSNKFYPPHIDEDQSLFRSHLIESILPGESQRHKVIAIEAQAGQGKTTLAYQYISHYKHNHIWYQIGREDADPVLLLSGLLHNLSMTLPGFSSPKLEHIVNQGEIGPMDLLRCANILLNDIDRHLAGRLYIVFDDLHLIEDAELTNNLIAYLLDTSPPNLHFVLTSRHPFELKSKTIRNRNAVAYLTTKDLALNSNEIERLFNDIFNRSISISEARKIEDVTAGWVMGIVLAAHPISGKKSMAHADISTVPFLDSPTQKDMLEYFQDEIFSHISEDLHIPFLKLSFLDEIHVELASRISGVEDIDIILTELTQENLFIYNLDTEYNNFRFHHLFQEFLQARAKKILNEQEIKIIYGDSAAYFLEKNMVEKALHCYQQGGEYEQMDHLLYHYGLKLLAQNRTLTILNLLNSIDDQTLLQYGWLTLYSGILGGDFHPQKTLDHLEAARKMFREQGEEKGELLALAQIIYYHFVVSGRYHTGAGLLRRIEDLLEKNRNDLSKNVIILVARNLAAGFCFFSGDMDNARKYINTALTIAIDNNIRNFMASTVFIKAYISLLTGNRKDFRNEVETSYRLLNDPLVGMSNKLTLRVMHICNLSMHGDITNYFHQQQLIQETIDKRVVKQTVAAPYFFIWGTSCFISMGETSKGLDLLNRGVNVSSTAKSEHMLSQLLQWQAYILAIHGNNRSAAVKIEEAAQLRDIAGGPFYEAFHAIIAGAVYGRLKKKKLAKDFFSRAIKLAEAIPSPYLLACALLQKSYFILTAYGEKSVRDDLERGLEIMIAQEYDHFWGWEPVAMTQLLTSAIQQDLHRTFCRKLAHKRFKVHITNDGEIIPLLRCTVLDGFSMSTANTLHLTVEQLTPLQRELLSLLLMSKDKKIGQEKVQLLLWPDSSPEKSRKKLDTLLGRLRSTFSEHLPVHSKNYLVLNKGILSLENTVSDLEEFLDNCKAGFKHADRDEFWQAGNRFYDALQLWGGSLPSDTFHNDSIYVFEDSLLATYEKMSLRWSQILTDAERQKEAIPILTKLLHTNPLMEEAVILLCRVYDATYQPLKIREILDNYRKALLKAEYEKDEIEEMITAVAEALEQPH